MGEMVLTMSTYPGAASPLGFSLREPLSLAQSFAFAFWDTWFLRSPPSGSQWSPAFYSQGFPRAAKSVPRAGHGGAGGCWLHKGEKKVYLKLKLNSYKILHFVGKSTTT